MIPLPKFKDLLGPEAAAMTEEEIRDARAAIYQLVEIAFDFWQQEKRRKNIVNSISL